MIVLRTAPLSFTKSSFKPPQPPLNIIQIKFRYIDMPNKILISLVALLFNYVKTAPPLGTIQNELFNGNPKYDKLSRPDIGSQPTRVRCQYKINSVMDVIPKLNQFTVDLFLRTEWLDDRLAYTHDIGKETLQADPDLLWKPDIYFHNEAAKMEVLDGTLKIKNNGMVFWSRHYIVKLSAKFDLHDFPFDAQTLQFKLISFANNENILNLSYFDDKNGGPVFPPIMTTFSSVLWEFEGESHSIEKEVNRDRSPKFDLLVVITI
jgi:hypothetical protein